MSAPAAGGGATDGLRPRFLHQPAGPARGPGVLLAARQRLEADLAARGRPFAAFAATVLVCRGRLLLDPVGFARLLGVDPAHVRALESGWRPPADAPRRLAALGFDLGWAGVGLDATDATDRARRHPANGRAGPRRGKDEPP